MLRGGGPPAQRQLRLPLGVCGCSCCWCCGAPVLNDQPFSQPTLPIRLARSNRRLPACLPPPAGVDALYVHTMAVNEIAVAFYRRNGFVVEKEESSNQAHYRGRCLDGIEGRGRTVLMRDTRLRGA